MPQYIAADRLKAAVDRLRCSRASGGMVNFLILKRAVCLAEGNSVGLSSKDTHFQQAITDLAWWPVTEDSDVERPFIDVFGSINARENGTKKKKYRSNGPADTLKNGAWSPIVEVTQGANSKMASLTSTYEQRLSEMVLLKAERPMPRIADAAAWYFRSRDVEPITQGQDSPEGVEQRLVEEFSAELALSDTDASILFAVGEDDE